jgi:hypothetical protein
MRVNDRLCDEADWIIVRNTHEPIIDEETFETVQKIDIKKEGIQRPPWKVLTSGTH